MHSTSKRPKTRDLLIASSVPKPVGQWRSKYEARVGKCLLLFFFFLETRKMTRNAIAIGHQNCPQSHSFWLKYASNRSAAGASPETHWRSSRRSPRPPLLANGRGRGEGEGNGWKRKERKEGKGTEAWLPPLNFKSV